MIDHSMTFAHRGMTIRRNNEIQDLPMTGERGTYRETEIEPTLQIVGLSFFAPRTNKTTPELSKPSDFGDSSKVHLFYIRIFYPHFQQI